jgi:hypothetical protein
MRNITLPLPALGFVISTRAALGAGIGLLVANRLSSEQRRAIGIALLTVGAATTIPAAFLLKRSLRRSRRNLAIDSDARLIGATRYPRKGDDLDLA